MSKQLHKNFTDGQVKSLFEKYSKKEIKLNYILQILRIKRSRFFELLTRYRKNPDKFSIQYKRNTSNYRIDREIEANIIQELEIEKDLIKAKEVPNRFPRLYRRGTFKTQAELVLSLPEETGNSSHPRLYRRGFPARLNY